MRRIDHTMIKRRRIYLVLIFVSSCLILCMILVTTLSNSTYCGYPKDPSYYREAEFVIESINSSYSSRPKRYLGVDDIPNYRARNVSCAKLFNRDEYERYLAVHIQATTRKKSLTEQKYISSTKNCPKFRHRRHYAMYPVSEEDENFSIAFSMLVYRDIEQFERLLRAIYRPQNYYCVHVDSKSSGLFHRAVKGIASCFENVFVTQKSVNVRWGKYSVLQPEFICMEELWRQLKAWKYFINLTGQEFPLRTNEELVQILRLYNGANNIEGTKLRMDSTFASSVGQLPCGISLTKGSVHITASRAFVNFILHSPIALEFREWIRRIDFSEEYFFSSLNHSPDLGVPGAYTGIPETDSTRYRFMTRFKNWGEEPFKWPCPGRRWIRQICSLSIGDLPLLAKRPELFANKFYLDFHPLALDCMEELHFNRTRQGIMRLHWNQTEDGETKSTRNEFDLEFYRNLDFVRNHV